MIWGPPGARKRFTRHGVVSPPWNMQAGFRERVLEYRMAKAAGMGDCLAD